MVHTINIPLIVTVLSVALVFVLFAAYNVVFYASVMSLEMWKSDVYYLIYSNGKKQFKSHIERNTATPVWNQMIAVELPIDSSKLEVVSLENQINHLHQTKLACFWFH